MFGKPFLIVATTIAAAAPALAAPPAATYVKMAGAGDQYEIQSSELVMGSTRNANLKTFAQQMVTDHTKSTADVTAAAKSSGLKPMPPKLMPKQASDLAALKSASGSARDALYIKQQKAAHAEALALHTDYSSSGDKPALKSTASAIVPVVERHKQMIDSM
jgi:putative membrane protein